MKSRPTYSRKANYGTQSARNGRDRSERRLLSVRSTLVIALALLSAIGSAILLSAAHRTPALITLSALGTFGGALKLFDSIIE
jgi:hypothetical protein